jgi:pimeloyl-ACP methyl ester carboxylesterase
MATGLASRVLREQRAVLEFGAFTAALPWFGLLPRGDGHPVLVLPGYLASDASTVPLRNVLAGLGHRPHGWELGRNRGPDRATRAALARRFEQVWDAGGGRPLSLVGWSLGGVYARGLARRYPDRVRQVITLGSPFRTVEVEAGQGPPPTGIPCTAIWSRSDAVVPWRAACEDDRPLAENIEVRGSHLGLGHNPAVVVAVADRLAQQPGSWRPFRPTGPARRLFPSPSANPTNP